MEVMLEPKSVNVLGKLMVTFTDMSKAAYKSIKLDEFTFPIPDGHILKLYEQIAPEVTWLYINLPCLGH